MIFFILLHQIFLYYFIYSFQLPKTHELFEKNNSFIFTLIKFYIWGMKYTFLALNSISIKNCLTVAFDSISKSLHILKNKNIWKKNTNILSYIFVNSYLNFVKNKEIKKIYNIFYFANFFHIILGFISMKNFIFINSYMNIPQESVNYIIDYENECYYFIRKLIIASAFNFFLYKCKFVFYFINYGVINFIDNFVFYESHFYIIDFNPEIYNDIQNFSLDIKNKIIWQEVISERKSFERELDKNIKLIYKNN